MGNKQQTIAVSGKTASKRFDRIGYNKLLTNYKNFNEHIRTYIGATIKWKKNIFGTRVQ